MAKLRVRLVFPPELVTQPIIYQMGRDFNVVTNIRRADVTATQGWVILELEGHERDIENAVAWAASRGVAVELIPGDVVEG